MRLQLSIVLFVIFVAQSWSNSFLLTPGGSVSVINNDPRSFTTSINNLNQVVWNNYERCYLWTEQSGSLDIGSLGGGFTFGYEVNDKGAVVGFSRATDGRQHAFLWTPTGGMVDLGLPGESSASGINSSGQIVGYFSSGLSATYRAFLWDPIAGVTTLDSYLGYSDYAMAINNEGQIAGMSEDPISSPVWGRRPKAYLWTRNGGFVGLGDLGAGFARVSAISQSGVIVGYSSAGPSPSAPHLPFVWSRSTGMVNLGGNSEGVATAITDSAGILVSNSSGGFVYRNGQTTTLNFDYAFVPRDINDSGYVVGDVTTPEPSPSTMFCVAGTAWVLFGLRRRLFRPAMKRFR